MRRSSDAVILVITFVAGAITLALALYGPSSLQVRTTESGPGVALQREAEMILGPLTRIAHARGISLPDSLTGTPAGGGR